MDMVKINFIVVALLLLFIGVQDVRCRLIDNRHLIGLFFLIISLILLSGNSPNVLLALVTLAVGFLVFCGKVMGAGDVKLMAVLALALSTANFVSFIFITALLGGLLAIGGLIFFRDITRRHGVPYGMAISLSFVLTYS